MIKVKPKLILLSCLLFLTESFIFAQNVSFEPKWEKGEIRIFETQIIDQKFFNGEKISETESSDRKIVEIVNTNKKFCVFHLTTENNIITHISKTYPYIDEHFKNQNTLLYQLKYRKQDNTIYLLDWDVHNQYIQNLLDTVYSVIKINNPKDYLLSLEMIEGLKNEFTDSLNMISYITSLIPAALISFRAPYGLKSPEVYTFRSTNPFEVNQKVMVKSEQYVQSFDKKKKQYTLKVSDRYDLSNYVQEGRTFAMKVLQAIQPNEDSTSLESLAQKVKSEYTQVHTIIQNKKDSWPTYYTQNTILINADWKQEIKQITIKKTLIKDGSNQ